MMRRFLLAIQFLTIFPLSLRAAEERDLSGSMAFYPFIGSLIGIILYAGMVLSSFIFPSGISVGLTVLLWVVITGGLHLDGLADTLDGFIGGRKRETVLTIMRDPTIGTMGVLGIFSVLMLKGVALFSIAGESKYLFNSLIFIPAAGRYLMVFGSFVSRYPHSQGTGKSYIGKISLSVFTVASVVILVIAGSLFHLKGLMLLAAVLAGAGLWIFYCHKRIGGMTGDNLGALGEVSEAVLLLLLTVNPV